MQRVLSSHHLTLGEPLPGCVKALCACELHVLLPFPCNTLPITVLQVSGQTKHC